MKIHQAIILLGATLYAFSLFQNSYKANLQSPGTREELQHHKPSFFLRPAGTSKTNHKPSYSEANHHNEANVSTHTSLTKNVNASFPILEKDHSEMNARESPPENIRLSKNQTVWEHKEMVNMTLAQTIASRAEDACESLNGPCGSHRDCCEELFCSSVATTRIEQSQDPTPTQGRCVPHTNMLQEMQSQEARKG